MGAAWRGEARPRSEPGAESCAEPYAGRGRLAGCGCAPAGAGDQTAAGDNNSIKLPFIVSGDGGVVAREKGGGWGKVQTSSQAGRGGAG